VSFVLFVEAPSEKITAGVTNAHVGNPLSVYTVCSFLSIYTLSPTGLTGGLSGPPRGFLADARTQDPWIPVSWIDP
jgi:hypothetical protein